MQLEPKHSLHPLQLQRASAVLLRDELVRIKILKRRHRRVTIGIRYHGPACARRYGTGPTPKHNFLHKWRVVVQV